MAENEDDEDEDELETTKNGYPMLPDAILEEDLSEKKKVIRKFVKAARSKSALHTLSSRQFNKQRRVLQAFRTCPLGCLSVRYIPLPSQALHP